MKRTRIRVGQPEFREGIFRYASIEEALASVGTNPREKRATRDTPSVAGAIIEGFQLGDETASVILSSGRAITARLTDTAIEWVIQPVAEMSPEPPEDRYETECTMVWSKVGESVWSRSGLLQDRVGGEIWMLHAGHCAFRIYVRNMLILEFNPLIDLATGRKFLYWDEDD